MADFENFIALTDNHNEEFVVKIEIKELSK